MNERTALLLKSMSETADVDLSWAGSEWLDHVAKLEERIRLHFTNKALLLQALVDPRYLKQSPKFPVSDNKRLEMLGDRVLSLIVCEYLFTNHPSTIKDHATWRDALICGASLAQIANEIGLSEYILVPAPGASEGELWIQAKENAVEALIGAFYLDQGLEATRWFVEGLIKPKMSLITQEGFNIHPKSRLGELVQERERTNPRYRQIGYRDLTTGPEFTVAVSVNGFRISIGTGGTIREAEIDAAQKALIRYGNPEFTSSKA
jgi:ribonuclease-3